MYVVFKVFMTAALIVLISEVAKRNPHWGAILAALPIMSILTWLWLFVEKESTEKIANYAYATFWYVIPSLPMFLLFPWLLKRLGFSIALISSILLAGLCFVAMSYALKKLGIQL